MTEIQLTVPGGAATALTVDGITCNVAVAYDYGTTPDGEKYWIAPAGIKVASIDPAPVTESGRVKNGAMQNPQRATLNYQALDNGWNGSSAMGGYDATKAANLATVKQPNDCLIKVKSTASILVQRREGVADTYGGFHVRATRAPAGAFAAPYIYPAGDLANRPWRVADVDGFLSAIPVFAAVGPAITWAQLQPYMDHLDLGRAITRSAADGGYEYLARRNSGDVADSNYDRYDTRLQAGLLCELMMDRWSEADKTAAVIRLLQRGCQEGEAIVAFGSALGEDGGHYGSQYAPAMAWLKATGREDQRETWAAMVGGNVTGQYYYTTAGQFAPHDDPLKPYMARRRSVIAVTNGGLTVEVTGYFPGSGLTLDTAGNGVLDDLNLVRESDDAAALITASTDSGANWLLTLAAPISGLTNGQTVFCRSPVTIPDGTPDFVLRNAVAHPNLPNLSPSSAYRDLQPVCIQNAFLKGIGMIGPTGQASLDYTVRCMTPGSGLPSQCDTIPALITGSSNAIAQAFWTAHSAALLALP